MVTVEDCERAQTCWFTCRAEVLGGEVRTDGPLTWVWEPGAMNLMFPKQLPADAVARGVARACELGAESIGAWLSLDIDAAALAAAGFERGWSPWWMTAPVAAVGTVEDPRIELQDDTIDYTGEYADYAASLAVARHRPRHTWYAAAYDDMGGAFAGRAWSHLTDELAGVFDMAVWPPFQRRGLGSSLLRTVVAAAGRAGAEHAVLNATPMGKLLYETCGFRQIGAGITWWLHDLPTPPDQI
jgi:GNAT superfamily N-acetyltransferase